MSEVEVKCNSINVETMLPDNVFHESEEYSDYSKSDEYGEMEDYKGWYDDEFDWSR